MLTIMSFPSYSRVRLGKISNQEVWFLRNFGKKIWVLSTTGELETLIGNAISETAEFFYG